MVPNAENTQDNRHSPTSSRAANPTLAAPLARSRRCQGRSRHIWDTAGMPRSIPARYPARHLHIIKLAPCRTAMKLTIRSSEGEGSRVGHHVLSHISILRAKDLALQDVTAFVFSLRLPLQLRQVSQQARSKLARLPLDPIQALVVEGLL